LLLYKVNASTTARTNGRMVLNGSTEIKGGKGENSATHVSLASPGQMSDAKGALALLSALPPATAARSHLLNL
jgi:hypothetical protein